MKRILSLGFIAIIGFLLVACDTNITTTQTEITEATRTFTLEELAQYTGANGSTAYIAVDGIVYDVTNVFVNGTHQGLQLGGTDATLAFSMSPHSDSLLETLPIVGVLVSNTSITTTETTTEATTTTTTTTETTTTVTEQTLPIFTLTELAQYTGANGTTAYIAVYGIVYDVTHVFVNGTHQGIQLGGTDATAVFESSPHSMSILATLPIIGTLEGYDPIVINSTDTTTTIITQTQDDDDDDEYEDDYEEEDD